MKLKDIKGLLPEKKTLILTHGKTGKYMKSSVQFNKGFNQALDELAEKEIELDEEKVARKMHKVYEEQAKIVGWKTQENCQVEFDDLPEANKKVMYAVATALSNNLKDILKVKRAL